MSAKHSNEMATEMEKGGVSMEFFTQTQCWFYYASEMDITVKVNGEIYMTFWWLNNDEHAHIDLEEGYTPEVLNLCVPIF